MNREAIILAGGFGTRLKEVVNDVPKPMAPVNTIPFLNYLLRYLKHYRIERVVLSVGYLSEKIMQTYKNSFETMSIAYAEEKTPLGTGGGIRLAMEQCSSETVLVLNGDSFFDANLDELYEGHDNRKADCTLCLREVANASRYGTIELDAANRVKSFREKDGLEKAGLINAGVYLMDRDIYLKRTPANTAFSIEKDFFEKQLNDLAVFGIEQDGYFIDIGIPEDYNKAQDDFKGFKY